MPLIGTAGHVDHGKSTLIQRLTGRDPDRFTEEKERGLTIDLGFAWTTLPDGTEVSFVDVPGHERYLKNMLAGIEAIDLALFVVAADEGWMPQSEEHLAVLDLLDVDRGVVALTKTDLVDSDLTELATLEVTERLEGTALEGSPITPVSGTTGAGVDDLLETIQTSLDGFEASNRQRPRLWVDRVFTIGGVGTVVTGSLIDGDLGVGDEVLLYRSGNKGRIRGIQTHEHPVDRVGPGRRVALNLAGVDRDDTERGDMVGLPGQWLGSARFLASVRPARYVEELDPRGDFQIHIGSHAERVQLVALDDGAAIIATATPLPLACGDRFILRDTGRRLVVAGGRVLDPAPGPTRTALTTAASLDPTVSPDRMSDSLLELRQLEKLETLRAHSGGGTPTEAVSIGDDVITETGFRELQRRATEAVENEHSAHPLRVGLSLATLAGKLDVSQSLAEAVIEHTDDLERIGPDVAVRGRAIQVDAESEAEWQRVRSLLEAGLAVPTVSELDLDPELLHFLIRRGDLVRVSEDLVMLRAQIDHIRETIISMPGEFTVAEYRDATGLSRKYAVPLLEWADMEGLTVRRGDTRSVR